MPDKMSERKVYLVLSSSLDVIVVPTSLTIT